MGPTTRPPSNGTPSLRETESPRSLTHTLDHSFIAPLEKDGAFALRILHDAGVTVVGAGEPAATVRTTRFEIVRASFGLRSYAQIATWDWEGDPRPESVVLARFAPPRSTSRSTLGSTTLNIVPLGASHRRGRLVPYRRLSGEAPGATCRIPRMPATERSPAPGVMRPRADFGETAFRLPRLGGNELESGSGPEFRV